MGWVLEDILVTYDLNDAGDILSATLQRATNGGAYAAVQLGFTTDGGGEQTSSVLQSSHTIAEDYIYRLRLYMYADDAPPHVEVRYIELQYGTRKP